MKKTKDKQKSFSTIEAKSFITVLIVLSAVIVICGALSYFIPQGRFLRDENGNIIVGTYVEGETDGIAIWRILTSPIRVFASEDAVTIIMISIFLLIMSGVFNLLDKTGGIKIFISKIMSKLHGKNEAVVMITVLIFMLFGSFFGMFEELATLLPIVVLFMLSMGMDTMMGLGACLMAACFGFASAITNPFSVGLASQIANIPTSSGVWLRIVFFIITYLMLCGFLLLHARKIKKNPQASPSYNVDLEKNENLKLDLQGEDANSGKKARVYGVFFMVQGVVLLSIAFIRAISDYAIPILAASFLICGIICGCIVSEDKKSVFKHLGKGAVAMLPAVVLIGFASSVKLVMTESGIIDTIMNYAIEILSGKNPFIAVILIYALILILQVFIGSASAKIFLVMPIVMPITTALGLSPSLVILAYCMADGFTDVILPTNPILLIGLSMVNVPYAKWVKWTWKLQIMLLIASLGVLFFAVAISY